MRVVVLGHRGVVGSAITKYLSQIDLDLVGVDRENYSSVRGPADIVINAAGSSVKQLALSDPLTSFRANVDATLASVLDFPCDLYVYVSSVTVYEDLLNPERTSEASTIDPLRVGPYAFFKLLGELVVRRHARRWLVLRLGNIVGPGLQRNPIYDLLTGSRLFVHPSSTMAFIDTRAFARILWALRDQSDQIFNVSGRGTVRLADVARILGTTIVMEAGDLPVEDQHINITKLSALFDVPRSSDAVSAFVSECRSRQVELARPDPEGRASPPL